MIVDLLREWWIWNCLQGSVRFREELENLFSAAIPPDKNVTKSKSAPIANKPEKLQLINHRRAYNVEIMLSKVNIPLHELMEEAVDDKAPQSERGIKSRAILGRQNIEVESGLGPYEIEYDEEWLAITRRKVHGGQQSMVDESE
ncbi:unnamed protein product [Lactuca saligna]|uniref:FH2 domain-containing protein n=1 Tax=Lactuca saligna TaxID=75948 RepID=A0AA35VLM5_LACSI|nr:unnamed protein product [Lactuca saligna]